jgi:hypothetical protein
VSPAPKATLGAKLRYRFDNALARGPFVVIAYLGLLVLLIIFVSALVATISGITFGGSASEGFFEDLWQAMLRMVDAGTFAGDAAWPTRLVALLVTVLGIFLAGSLIGLIAAAVDGQVQELNRGRGAVIESEHTLILGWSPQVPQIISELVIANESEKDPSIVVLARADKAEMEETVRDIVGDTKNTRVVCRNGDPSVPADLERACIAGARSIIAVRDEDGDAAVVKAILAIRALDPDLSIPDVAEIAAEDNASTLRTVSHGRVLTVSSERIVAEVTAQACLQSGLAAVFADLLDFDGDEIYFTPVGALAGQTYAEALLAYERSSVVGRVKAGDGATEMNPKPDVLLDADDQLIVIAGDDSAVQQTGMRTVTLAEPAAQRETDRKPVRALVVGWSQFGRLVMQHLDEFLVPGSSVHVQVDIDLVDPASIGDLQLRNASVTVGAGRGGPEDLTTLAADDEFDQVIVLGYRDALGASDADARTLLSLLALRMIWPKDGEHEVRIVAELVDQRNLAIATPVGIDDLIVSDALASLMMAQLSENVALQSIFDDLFDPYGPVVTMRRAATIVPSAPVEWAHVVAGASAQEASAFGYRDGVTGEVFMNPPKSKPVQLGGEDLVILVETRSAAPALEQAAPPKKRTRPARTTK